jgi:uncharacterized membrane protein/predicted DsbA family dithiol-disulfide isomerase
MRITQRLQIIRLFAVVALGICAALLVNAIQPIANFCAYVSDCQQVLTSSYSRVLGIPLPAFGVAAFGALIGLSLCTPVWARRLFRMLAAASGMTGLVLMVIQIAVLRQLCPYCLAVNCFAVLVTLLSLSPEKHQEIPTTGKGARWLWSAGGAAAFSVGLGFGIAAGWNGAPSSTSAPDQVKSLWAPDKVNIVEVFDFDCPYCRAMHAALRELVQEEREHVHYVRLTAPLPGHRNARHASRAFLCAEQQDRGAEMAEALFATRDRSPDGCEQVAGEMGLSLFAFRSCVAAPATDARLDNEVAWVMAASPNGLPVVWIQDEMFYGVQPINVLRKAVQTAKEQSATSWSQPITH